jgi:hypothetical protein
VSQSSEFCLHNSLCCFSTSNTKRKRIFRYRFSPATFGYTLIVSLREEHKLKMSRDSSVGIALGYGLDDRSTRVRFPAGAGNFSLYHRVQNGSGAHPASYPMGTRVSFPGCKAAGREADHSPPCSAGGGQRMRGAVPPLPQYAFMAWCVVKHRDNFTFTFYIN